MKNQGFTQQHIVDLTALSQNFDAGIDARNQTSEDRDLAT
jgi:hypothetical protein